MLFSKTTTLLALVPFTVATTCSKSTSEPWSNYRPSGSVTNPLTAFCASICSGDASCLANCNDDPCKDKCGEDPTCYQSCAEIAQEGQCNSVGCPGGERLKKRVIPLDCTDSETCYQFTDGSFLCLDPSTNLYHDDEGGVGNAVTGAYTYADGEQIVVSDGITRTVADATGTAEATGEATADSTEDATTSSTRRSSSATRIASAASSTSAAVTSAKGSSGTVASATSATSASSAAASTTAAGSSADRVRAGAFVGAMGLVAGLVL